MARSRKRPCSNASSRGWDPKTAGREDRKRGVVVAVYARQCRQNAGHTQDPVVPRSGLYWISQKGRPHWPLSPFSLTVWKGRIRVETGVKRAYRQGLGPHQRPAEAVRGLGWLSLPHFPSAAGTWVLLGRMGLHFLVQALLGPFSLCPALSLPYPADPLKVSFSHWRWSWYWGLGRESETLWRE